MTRTSKLLRKGLTACALAAASLAPLTANAAVTQLGFILDRSGSIGLGNWTTIINGLSSAVNTLVPLGGTYEISVVTFSSSATLDINSFLVTDAASRTALAGLISGIVFTGGGTNFAPAFTLMNTALTDAIGLNGGGTTAANAAASFVNFATDGVEGDAVAGVAARNALIAAGIDNISIEGIGSGVDALGLQGSYCFPSPCDTTVPYNFPAQGFYVAVASAADYGSAIANKIQVVTGQVPEPGSMALIGAALLAAGAARRRRAIAA